MAHMSLGLLGLSWRRRVPLAAALLLLIGAVVAVPGVSMARNGNSVKQFTASIGGSPQTGWTETITNCGSPVAAPCTAASTINLGTALITVPPAFTGLTITGVTTSSGADWNATYSSGTIEAFANTGSDKLLSGQSVSISFTTSLTGCPLGSSVFATTAWGSNSLPTSNQFALQGDPPTLTIQSCTGPNGTEVTGSGFTGPVALSFQGLGLSCDYSTQWQSYHLPDQVLIDGSGATPTSSSGKTFTFAFPATPGVDSSWYLVCYASTTAWAGFHESEQGTDGNTYYVGVLSSCYTAATNSVLTDTPCVSRLYQTLPTSSDPDRVVISVLDPIDSWMH